MWASVPSPSYIQLGLGFSVRVGNPVRDIVSGRERESMHFLPVNFRLLQTYHPVHRLGCTSGWLLAATPVRTWLSWHHLALRKFLNPRITLGSPPLFLATRQFEHGVYDTLTMFFRHPFHQTTAGGVQRDEEAEEMMQEDDADQDGSDEETPDRHEDDEREVEEQDEDEDEDEQEGQVEQEGQEEEAEEERQEEEQVGVLRWCAAVGAGPTRRLLETTICTCQSSTLGWFV